MDEFWSEGRSVCVLMRDARLIRLCGKCGKREVEKMDCRRVNHRGVPV